MSKHYIYHILPTSSRQGKVGATEDLEWRVETQQGCNTGDYVILHTTEDLKEASDMEIHFQNLYGYATDQNSYYDIKNKNKNKNNNRMYELKAASTRSDFLAINKGLRDVGQVEELFSNGVVAFVEFSELKFTAEQAIKYLLPIMQESQWRESNSKYDFYWNPKAVDKAWTTHVVPTRTINDPTTVWYDANHGIYIPKIEAWAKDLGIIHNAIETQTLKLNEEVGELNKAVLEKDIIGIKDGIGDIVVVLTSLATIAGSSIGECIKEAWEEIQTRQAIKDGEGNVIATHTPGQTKNTDR